MKRLFFLVPDLKTTRSIAQEMEEVGVTENHIHVLGGSVESLKRAHLHRANLFQTTDLAPALKRGLIIGLVLACVIYGLFTLMLPEGVKIPNLGLAAIGFFGVGFGLWASGMIGVGIQNAIVEKHENFIKEGHYIMMIDVPPERYKELAGKVVNHHPGTKLADEPMH